MPRAWSELFIVAEGAPLAVAPAEDDGPQRRGLFRRLRENIPVVLVSGYIGPRMSEKAALAGVAEILKKPVHSRDLAAALARALHQTPSFQP